MIGMKRVCVMNKEREFYNSAPSVERLHEKTNRTKSISDVLFDKDLLTVPWVCRGLGIPPDSLRVFMALAFVRNGVLLGSLLFHDGYAEKDVWWTLYTVHPLWCTRQFLKKAFRAAFVDLKCQRIGVLVRADNIRSLKLVRRLGFHEEGCLRQLCADKTDCLAFSMLKEECRWL